MLRSSESNTGVSQAPSAAMVTSIGSDVAPSPSTHISTATASLIPPTSATSSSSDAKQISVTFQGKPKLLTFFRPKTSGKNKSHPLDGFYFDEVKNEYFIKVPSDKRELFTELLAGKVLTKMKAAGLIPEKYHHLIICADLVQFRDGTYGLIQPCKKFKEIWTYFKAKFPSDSTYWGQLANLFSGDKDRNPFDEMLFGKSYYYPSLAELRANDSLAACLLFSFVIGNYSVHSANMVYFKTEVKVHNAEEKDSCYDEEESKVYKNEIGIIDLGAAWRNFGHDNNGDVMKPMEYHGFKGITKGYHHFYTNVPDLFRTISSQAADLLQHLASSSTSLSELIYAAINIKEIPDDLLNATERAEAAEYIGFETFKSAGTAKSFAQDITRVMMQRITDISLLPQTSPDLMETAETKAAKAAGPTRLGSNQMFDFALIKVLKAANETSDSKGSQRLEIIEPTETNPVYGARFNVNGQSIVLLSPSSDDTIQNDRNIGTTVLPIVLKKLRDIQARNPLDTFLIPLAECQTIMMIPRQHWTMLMIQGNNCHFFDPCSDSLWPSLMSASSFYSLTPLKKILSANEITLHDQNVVYLGWQTDNVNCGRFSAAIAEKAAVGLFARDDMRAVQVALLMLDGRAKPQASTLVTEFLTCRRDPLIAESKAICDQRGQEFIPPIVKQDPLVRSNGYSQSARLLMLTTNEVKQDETVEPEIKPLPIVDPSCGVTPTHRPQTQMVHPELDDTKRMGQHTLENIQVTEAVHPITQPLLSAHVAPSTTPMPQDIANLNKCPDFIHADEAKRTLKWKYVLAGVGIILGLAAIASGVGAFGGLGLLAAVGTELAGALIGGGALSFLSGLFYTRHAVKNDNQDRKRVVLSTPGTSAKNGFFSTSYQSVPPAPTSPRILDVISNELPFHF